MSLDGTATGFERKTMRIRKREFLNEMNLVVPYAELVALIVPPAPTRKPKCEQRPFELETMLRIQFLQQLFNLSDPSMEEALYDTELFREFGGLEMGEDQLPDESTILRFEHLLEAHDLSVQILTTINATLPAKCLLLKQGAEVDATLISAPTSTKNSSDTRYPEMHQTRKGNQSYHSMKAHRGVDADSGLVHSVAPTAANAHDVTQAQRLLHGDETDVFADSGYRGVEKRDEIEAQHLKVNWHIAMMPGKRKALDKESPMDAILEKLGQTKASIRTKVEQLFRVIKRQIGYEKVKYRRRAKKAVNLVTLFALSNLWIVRKRLLNKGA